MKTRWSKSVRPAAQLLILKALTGLLMASRIPGGSGKGALVLPRPFLLSAAWRRTTVDQIAAQYSGLG